jgi:SAM-dependent methyltransferase
MTFSSEWESLYSKQEHLSIWPWSDLVSFVMRYARPTGPAFRVLEIGVGAGANIAFFRNLNVDYYAVDGSESIVRELKKRYADWADRFMAVDFTVDLGFKGPFDLVVDRASLTSNPHAAVQACLKAVHTALKPGGRFLSIDMYSTEHADARRGTKVDDFARTFTDGQFAGTGTVHFIDAQGLRNLLKDFEIEVLEHKVIDRVVPGPELGQLPRSSAPRFGSFNCVARKPG